MEASALQGKALPVLGGRLMSKELAIIEQVVLYLGKPWRLDRRALCQWQYMVIDGTGRRLVMRPEHGKPKLKISGAFPACHRYANSNHYKSIGVSFNRAPKDIAADIQRRLIPHYLEAFEEVKATSQKQQKDIENMLLVARALVQVTGGRVDHILHNTQCQVHFVGGSASIYTRNDIDLKLRNLSPEMAIKLAGLLKS